MSHLDCVGQLRETMARVSQKHAQILNTSLKLLARARSQNEEEGKRILKEMVIHFDVFSRVLRETLVAARRNETIEEVASTYDFQRKDRRTIGSIVDYWLAAYDR
jgi:hypothetical protein